MVDKIIAHSKTALSIAKTHGWLIGACYINLRNITSFKVVHFIDIDWKNYSYDKHLDAVKKYKPKYTVARDWEKPEELNMILEHAEILNTFAQHVIIVPKVETLKEKILELIPDRYILGYSVPTKYGATKIAIEYFGKRRVHLLGGRPDRQRELANSLNVVSIDCNRFTLDARYGDYFDGRIFKPHPIGGYKKCMEDSIKNINMLWNNYG